MSGKYVVVTGAAGALGRTVVARLAEAGHFPVAVDLAGADLLPSEARYRFGGVDLSNEDKAVSIFERIGSEIGAIHGLANIAGGFAWEMIADGSLATWDRLYSLNLRTALNACRAALPILGRGSAIVNVGAAGAARAGVGMGAYAASKAAVEKLTEALAAELKDKGVRANAVLPSIIDTAANRTEMPDADHEAWVTPQELAGVIEFLVSDRASGISGAAIPVIGRV